MGITLAKWLLEFLGIPRKILGIPRNLFSIVNILPVWVSQ